MIDDFRAPKPAKSLRDALDATKTKTPESQDESDPFQTPEEVAAAQDVEPKEPSKEDAPTTEKPESKPGESALKATVFSSTAHPNKAASKRRFRLSWPPGKTEYILAAMAILVLGGGGYFGWQLTHHQAKVVTAPKQTVKKSVAPVVPTTVPSTLTGLPVSPSVNQLPVTGVMIENSDFARPQSGLGQAGVVFEAIAEGGITRFLALFQDTSPTNVGPIRSARPYYEQWALGFNAGYAHVGGSPEALSDIHSWNVRDLDQFYNGSSYHRISSRAAPHNVYTSVVTLQQLEASKGYTTSTYTGLPRKSDSPAKQPTAATIKFTLSGPDYNVQYAYDAATNSYKRSEAGAAQTDANDGSQITPKVVIAMVMHYSLEADGYHSDYNVIGSGPAYVFQDGTVTTGTWAKGDNASQISFTAANGSVIKLNAGRTWITALAGTNDVSYTP